MKTHNLVQGSPEWLAYRTQHFNASDAPAMMGCSPYKTRSQLLHELHTGLTAQVDQQTKRLYDNGHRFEALARPLAEKIIGEDLYPVTGSEGKLSASFDGLTMAEDTAFEHKSMNAELYGNGAPWGDDFVIPLHYRVQMEQQLLVSGASRVLFMASRWNSDDTLDVEQHCWYSSDAELRQQIVAGWEQFAADLAAFVPMVEEVKPIGKTPETLPALHVEVTGMVTASNLAQYKEHALAVFGAINRDLQTEQDFADAEKIVKWCGDVETRLDAAKEHALSQTQSIDELFKAIDDIKAEARRTRLDLDKLVTKRKDEIRADIVNTARATYVEHLNSLNKEIHPASIMGFAPDFAGAIKGKRSLDSMRDAVDVALANGKIAADAQAKSIRSNLVTFHQVAEGYEFLFADLSTLVHKAADDFKLAVQSRVDARKASEKQAQEAADAAAKALAEVVKAPAPAMVMHGNLPVSMDQFDKTYPPVQKPATAPDLKLGVIAERLGFTVTADFLASLGFEAHIERNARLYHEADFPAICNALIDHIQNVVEGIAA